MLTYNVCIYIYICIHTYTHMHIYMCAYINTYSFNVYACRRRSAPARAAPRGAAGSSRRVATSIWGIH